MMKAIELYAHRHHTDFEQRLQHTEQLLREVCARYTPLVQATSLGVEDMVITDLVCRLNLPVQLAMLDTGVLHAQTLALKDTLQQRYQREVKVYRPDALRLARFVKQNGTRAMYQSVELRKACCQMRKLEPLQWMLAGQAGWITGLRQEQSDARAHVDAVQDDTLPDSSNGIGQRRVKISPLKDWNLGDVWHYVQLHGVSYNPLHDAFYPSIGCEPCTRAITPGEDFRAGRWWWELEGSKECGLHAHAAQALPDVVAVPVSVLKKQPV